MLHSSQTTTVLESGSSSRGALPLHRSSSAWRQPGGSLDGVGLRVSTVVGGGAGGSGAAAAGGRATAGAATGVGAGRTAGGEAQAPMTLAATTAYLENSTWRMPKS